MAARRIPVRIFLTICVVAIVATALAGMARSRAVEGWGKYRPMAETPTPIDRQASQSFLASNVADRMRYDSLFGYFLHGFIANAGDNFSLIHYPGLPSVYGYRVSGLEGFARTAPLLGAWIYSGRGRQVTDPQTGAVVDLVATLRSAIVAGTDPSAPGYWGKIDDDSQRIVEAADIARLLWLRRREIWSELDSGEKSRVYAWLAQVDHVKISSTNNWLLFPVVVDAFLRSVGYPADASRANYEAFKKNLLQNGWFRDGDRGRVDYYNAWAYPTTSIGSICWTRPSSGLSSSRRWPNRAP
jgi:hypothetical protein